MITKETTKRLKKSLTELLTAQQELKLKEAQYDKLKKQVASELKAVSGEFENGTLLVPGVAVVTTKLNPPKLVWRASGKPLTSVERAELSQGLPDSYVYVDIDIKKLNDAINRGNGNTSGLGMEMVRLEQDERFEIRKAV